MKKYTVALISLVLSILCGVAYNIIGSEVAADGTLIEPFFLIPMSYLFLAIAVVLGLVSLITSRKCNIVK